MCFGMTAAVDKAADRIPGAKLNPIFSSFCKIGNGMDWPGQLMSNRFRQCKQHLITIFKAPILSDAVDGVAER
jgi:hypothetical protein